MIISIKLGLVIYLVKLVVLPLYFQKVLRLVGKHSLFYVSYLCLCGNKSQDLEQVLMTVITDIRLLTVSISMETLTLH